MTKERVHTILEQGLAYLQRGWHLCAMNERTKGPTTQGWNTASELIDTAEKLVVRLSHGPQNLGLYHAESGTISIDVDHEPLTREIFEDFGLDYEKIITGGMRIWSKEGRDKVLYAGAPADLKLTTLKWPKQVQTKPNDTFTIFELRADNCQDVLPPSQHPDGHFYQWWPGCAPWEFEGELPQMPTELIDFWRQMQDRDTGLADALQNACPWKTRHVGKQLTQRTRPVSTGHGDVIGQFNQANDVGDMLQNNGYKKRGKRYLAPSSSTVIPGVVVLDDKAYSHHGSDLLADGFAHDAFDLLVMLEHGGDVNAALKDAANQLGIERKPQHEPIEEQVDLAAMLAAQTNRKLQARAIAPTPSEIQAPTIGVISNKPVTDIVYPPHLFKPPGILGVITDWVLQTSEQPQPILAVVTALSLVSVVLGRKVASPSNLRTNNYFVGLAETGFGKDHGRKCIKLALEEAGQMALLGGEDLASGAGLKSAVAAAPVSLFLIDEFGATLQAINSKNASNHEKDIADTLVKLFSSASVIMLGKEYADKKVNKRVDIPYPNACLYGTTVPKRFYDNLDASAISGGFLNRMLIVECSSQPPDDQEASLWGVPPQIVEWIKAARSIMPGMEDNGKFPVVVPHAPMAQTLLLQFRQELRARGIAMRADPSRAALADIWARAREHAIKIALVLSCAREVDPTRLAAAGSNGCLETDVSSMQWAIDFVKFLLNHMETAASTRMGESELDRQCQDALGYVKRAGARGCTTGDLNVSCRSFRALEPRIQDTVVEMLKRRGSVVMSQRQASKLSGHKAVAIIVVPEFGPGSPDSPDGVLTESVST